MGTISTFKKQDGSVSYTARVRIMRAGVQVHNEVGTFARKEAAKVWMKKRETELSVPGALEDSKLPDPTLGEIITRYLDEMMAKVGRTKGFTLKAIAKSGLGRIPASKIGSVQITEYAMDRLKQGAKPPTIKNDLVLLAGVFAVAAPAWGYRLSKQALDDAKAVASRLGYSTRALERTRRPTLDELDRLMTLFADDVRRRAWVVPMGKIVPFALFSTRRQDEISRILWSDVDEAGQRVLVREMKHPRIKATNHVWCHLPDEAWAILQSMPRVSDRIFPFGSIAISAQFTRACQWLEIEDLHFHDLRHEGISRLFEMDTPLPRVAAVSGHKDWNSMRRYTHMNGTGDKYADWPWLEKAIAQKVVMPRKKAPTGEGRG